MENKDCLQSAQEWSKMALFAKKMADVQYKTHLKLNKMGIEAFSLMIDEATSHNAP